MQVAPKFSTKYATENFESKKKTRMTYSKQADDGK